MIYTRNILYILTLSFFIISCFSFSNLETPVSNPEIINPTSTSSPWVTATLSIQNCVEVLETNPTSLSGNLFIRKNEEFPVSLKLNLNDNSTIIQPEKTYLHYPSPNQEKIVYVFQEEPGKSESIIITDINMAIQNTFEWKENWIYLQGWLDNNHVLINNKNTKNLPPYDLTILDINTGETIELISNYPNINQINYTKWNLSGTIYNPDITHVIYQTNDMEIVLWDLQENIKMTEVIYTSNRVPEPNWLGNGKEAILVGTFDNRKSSIDEFIKVDVKGTANQISNFKEINKQFLIDSFKISPNEQFIAFWGTTNGTLYKLYTLNLDTSIVNDLCFSSNSNVPPVSPIWSPDGTYLLLQIQEDKNNYVYIMDPEEHWVFLFMENSEVSSWIRN